MVAQLKSLLGLSEETSEVSFIDEEKILPKTKRDKLTRIGNPDAATEVKSLEPEGKTAIKLDSTVGFEPGKYQQQ